MKMVDMERTAAEKKAAEERMKAMPEGDDYPWGLSINLGKDELAKLGIDSLPKIGAEFRIVGIAKVTSVSASADTTDEHQCMGMQIIELGLEDDSDTTTAANKLYGEQAK